MKFRPCIDLHDGKVKQIIGSTLKSGTLKENYISDKPASYYAKLFKKDNITGGHIIMLDNRNESQVLSALELFPNGFQVGGGINADNAEHYLERGASHIIVTSYIFQDGKLHLDNLKKLRDTIGKKRTVLDLSARKKGNDYHVVTDKWSKFTSLIINADNLLFLSEYCDEFLIHAVDVEGKHKGPEMDLLKILGGFSPIISTYAGGIKSFDDVELVKKYGNERIDFTIGTALDIFGGDLSYKKVIDNYT